MDFITITAGGATASETAPARLPDDGFVWVDCLQDEPRAWVDDVQRLTDILAGKAAGAEDEG